MDTLEKFIKDFPIMAIGILLALLIVLVGMPNFNDCQVVASDWEWAIISVEPSGRQLWAHHWSDPQASPFKVIDDQPWQQTAYYVQPNLLAVGQVVATGLGRVKVIDLVTRRTLLQFEHGGTPEFGAYTSDMLRFGFYEEGVSMFAAYFPDWQVQPWQPPDSTISFGNLINGNLPIQAIRSIRANFGRRCQSWVDPQ